LYIQNHRARANRKDRAYTITAIVTALVAIGLIALVLYMNPKKTTANTQTTTEATTLSDSDQNVSSADRLVLQQDADGVWRPYDRTTGEVSEDYVGLLENEYGWWFVRNGQVDFSFNGIVQNKNGKWLVTEGAVNFDYSGEQTYEDTVYVIENGQVTEINPVTFSE